ncbi:MAG: histone deacetylase [Thermodesulfobacteriota bacterium]
MADRIPLHIVSHPRCLDHDTGGGEHPEVAARLTALGAGLRAANLETDAGVVTARPASRAEVTAVHPETYLLRLEEAALSGKSWLGHPDNQMGYDTYEIALLAAGAGLVGIDLLETGAAVNVFCPVRPPGHHAEPTVPLGFCFLNNCAIAARYWQRAHGRDRIAIFDFDAHHGNGIETVFEEDAEVFYISIHEHPTFSFPGTGFAENKGTGAGTGYTLNLPVMPGTGDGVVRELFRRRVVPAMEAFAPGAIIVAAGFDGHRDDDMSGLGYSAELYGFFGTELGALADRLCAGRLLSILEGGYHLESLAASGVQYCRALAGRQKS